MGRTAGSGRRYCRICGTECGFTPRIPDLAPRGTGAGWRFASAERLSEEFRCRQTARFSPFHKKGPHRPSARTCRKPNATAVATAVNGVPLAWRLADDYTRIGSSRPRVCAFPRLGSHRAFVETGGCNSRQGATGENPKKKGRHFLARVSGATRHLCAHGYSPLALAPKTRGS